MAQKLSRNRMFHSMAQMVKDDQENVEVIYRNCHPKQHRSNYSNGKLQNLVCPDKVKQSQAAHAEINQELT
jgi:t-SNARE complex subunit (syntaxin)